MMTETEIMKALECCSKPVGEDCNECPLHKEDCLKVNIEELALDLINRKNAENEKLCAEIDELIIAKDQLFDEAEALIKKARAEAIKEVLGEITTEIEEALRNNFKVRQERQDKVTKGGGNVFGDEIICTIDGKISALMGIGYFVDQIAKEMGVEL